MNGLALMPTPSKVLYVSHVAEIGGAEVALLDLVRLVDRSRVAPLVAWPGAGALGAALGQLGVPARVVPPFRLKRSISPIRATAAAAGVLRAAGAIAEIVRAGSVSRTSASCPMVTPASAEPGIVNSTSIGSDARIVTMTVPDST